MSFKINKQMRKVKILLKICNLKLKSQLFIMTSKEVELVFLKVKILLINLIHNLMIKVLKKWLLMKKWTRIVNLMMEDMKNQVA